MSHLDVDSGETYTISSGDTEEWLSLGTDSDPCQGTVKVNGSLKLIDNPDTPGEEPSGTPFSVPTNPLELPLSVTLPTSPLNLRNMQTGVALLLMFVLGLPLGAAAYLKNKAAVGMWGFAFFALIASGLFGIGLELFWAMIAATVFLIIMGALVRWMS